MRNQKEKFILEKKRGFLMTEAVLSLFVLTVGLTTVLALIASSMRNSFNSRDTIIAVELAQEGVELVRNVRDNAVVNTPTTPFLAFPPSTTKHCRIDYVSALTCTVAWTPPTNYVLQYTASGFYAHSGGTATKFSRYMYVDYNGTDTAIVKSFVYWGTAPSFGAGGDTTACTAQNMCVFTEITLTDWKSQ